LDDETADLNQYQQNYFININFYDLIFHLQSSAERALLVRYKSLKKRMAVARYFPLSLLSLIPFCQYYAFNT
jgi:hypothetical protein